MHKRTRTFQVAPIALIAASISFASRADAQAPSTEPVVLEEVIVTATKRSESVRDVAASVSAVTAEQIESLGAQSFADYIERTPGVVFNAFQPGTSHVVIRGVATNSGNVQGQGTTAYYVNEVPMTEPGWTIVIPDVDAFDVERVEILRGPQGSLFGSASMGGALNYISKLADPEAFDARIETTLSQTRNADLGYTGKAMINAPLSEDRFAVRGVITYRNEPGYLDNVGTGEDGSSDIATLGGRLSAVWTPNETTRLSWLSLYQKTDADDEPYRNPDVGDLKRNTALAEPNETDVQIHSLRLDQDFALGTFTALAAYQKKQQDYLFDFTPIRVLYNADLGLNLTSPLYILSGGDSDGESIELRYASKQDGRFEWLLGGMYFKSDKFLYEAIGAQGAAAEFDASPLFGPGTGDVIAPNGEIFNAFYTDVLGKETALFGEATFKFTSALSLTVGGRLYKNEVESASTQVGFSTFPGDPIVSPSSDEDDGFSPKVALKYAPREDLMMYAGYSEGFRFGSPNTQGLSAFPIPAGSTSDSLKNYELGVRTELAGGTMRLDATLFYIDWNDIQLRLQTPDFFNYAANGGSAQIKGVETAWIWAPAPRLEWQATVTYMEGRLSEPLSILFVGEAPEGAPLPGSSDWTISSTLDYRFGSDTAPHLLLSYRHQSEGISDLNSAVPGATPNEQGDFHLFDLRLRKQFGATTLALFGTNLTDERGVTRTLPEVNGLSQGLVRPRTFGVTLGIQF